MKKQTAATYRTSLTGSRGNQTPDWIEIDGNKVPSGIFSTVGKYRKNTSYKGSWAASPGTEATLLSPPQSYYQFHRHITTFARRPYPFSSFRPPISTFNRQSDHIQELERRADITRSSLIYSTSFDNIIVANNSDVVITSTASLESDWIPVPIINTSISRFFIGRGRSYVNVKNDVNNSIQYTWWDDNGAPKNFDTGQIPNLNGDTSFTIHQLNARLRSHMNSGSRYMEDSSSVRVHLLKFEEDSSNRVKITALSFDSLPSGLSKPANATWNFPAESETSQLQTPRLRLNAGSISFENYIGFDNSIYPPDGNSGDYEITSTDIPSTMKFIPSLPAPYSQYARFTNRSTIDENMQKTFHLDEGIYQLSVWVTHTNVNNETSELPSEVYIYVQPATGPDEVIRTYTNLVPVSIIRPTSSQWRKFTYDFIVQTPGYRIISFRRGGEYSVMTYLTGIELIKDPSCGMTPIRYANTTCGQMESVSCPAI